jgi:hypothetical protein
LGGPELVGGDRLLHGFIYCEMGLHCHLNVGWGEREREEEAGEGRGINYISGEVEKKRMLRDTRNPANPSVKKGKYLN